MQKKRIALVFRYAAIYRQEIYKKIDDEFDTEFYFTNNTKIKIKMMDYLLLNKANMSLKEICFPFGFYILWGNYLKIIRKNDDLIFCGDIRDLTAWILLVLCKIYKKKSIVWTHGWYGKESKLVIRVKKIFFNLADEVLLYGNYAKGIMIKQGFKRNNINCIYNSLNYSEQIKYRIFEQSSQIYSKEFNNKNKNIVFIGRLLAEKKLDMILYAIHKLNMKGENYNITFIGEGSEKIKLENLSFELGICNQVWFYGECYNEKEISILLNRADICVSPGNIGLTAMHALMYGVPIITHNNFKYQGPEFEAVKEWETGCFFEYNSIDSLVNCISKWFSIHNDSNEIKESCYKIIDDYYNPNKQLEILKSII